MKKIALFFVFALLIGVVATPVLAYDRALDPVDSLRTEMAMGDMNQNGKVDAVDALLLLRRITHHDHDFFPVGGASPTDYGEAPKASASDLLEFELDLNANGKVDAADALYILRFTVGKWEPAPEYFSSDGLQVQSYPAEADVQSGGWVADSYDQLLQTRCGMSIKNKMQYKTFDFEHQELLLVADPFMAEMKVLQVVRNRNQILVQYEYGQATECRQVAAIPLPKGNYDERDEITVHRQKIGSLPEKGIYFYEFAPELLEGDTIPWQAGESALVGSYGEWMVTQKRLREPGYVLFPADMNEQSKAYWGSDYFDRQALAIYYEYDVHGHTDLNYVVDRVERKDGVATVYLKNQLVPATPTDLPDDGAGLNARLTALVMIVQLSAEDVEGCHSVVFSAEK